MSVLLRLVLPLCLAAFGVVYFLQAGTIHSLYSQGPVGPGDVPKWYAVALGIAVAAAVAGDLRRKRTEAAPIDWGGLLAAALVIAASGVYVALFRPLGYLAATAVYAVILLAVFSRLKMGLFSTILQTAALVAAVYLLFEVAFNVRLPEGAVFESLLSPPGPEPTDPAR
jgi:putative tricarboxylic transport membrane protein